MLSKSLIQFSVDGWSCVPSLFFTWSQTVVEVMKIMVTYFKRSHACTGTLSAPNPSTGQHQPTPSPETYGHPQEVSCGVTVPFSWVLLHQGSVVPSKSLVPSPLISPKDVLFIIGDWNAKVGSQETPGVTGKFGLGIRNGAGQRIIEFCQENSLVIANSLIQQNKRQFYT